MHKLPFLALALALFAVVAECTNLDYYRLTGGRYRPRRPVVQAPSLEDDLDKLVYVQPEEVAAMLKNESLTIGRDFAIIDVRGDDFVTGNIIGCTNIPATTLKGDPKKYVQELNEIPKLIFHCEQSSYRGPTSAVAYIRNKQNEQQQVVVLKGGFMEFGKLYNNDTELVENYDQDYWKNKE